MKAFLVDWARAVSYVLADLFDMLAEWLTPGPPEPPGGAA